jgi:hypothetical protein
MDEPTPQTAPPPSDELSYEETPVINTEKGELLEHTTEVHTEPEQSAPKITYEREDVVPEATQFFQSQSQTSAPAPEPPLQHQQPSMASREPQKTSKTRSPNHIGTYIFIIILFGLGVWLSTQLRSFFAPSTTAEVTVPTLAPSVVVPTVPVQASSSATPDTSWISYQVISGATRKEVAGVSYKLPAGVVAPVCDSGNCVSQGTNLPNGTRFTIAVRGKGQLLPDFRGAILTDANGKEFTMKQTTINGVYGYEYIGNFTGRTGGGYAFSAMRGIEVPVSDTLSVEFNHFAPVGTTSDFAKDEIVFNSIIGTFKSTIPVTTLAPTIPTATSSGL